MEDICPVDGTRQYANEMERETVMIFSENQGIRIAAIAASVPETVVDIKAKMEDPEEDPKFIKNFMRNTGIKEKRKSMYHQTAADFSYSAAKQIEQAGKYKPEEIGILINLTQTPDYRSPSTALPLHKRLGLSKSCMAFDINLGCSGFVYGVSIAANLLSSTNAQKALVLVGDTLGRRRKPSTNRRSSNTALLFGDASAAVLLERGDGTIRSALMSDGTGHKALSSPYLQWKHPIGPESIPGDDIAVFNFTIREVPELIKDFMEKVGTSIEDYDALALHQANMMIIKNVAKRVGMPMEKVPVCLDRFGNTSGASVPLSLVDAYGASGEDSLISVLASGFGIGLSWGVVDFRINVKDILPLGISDAFYDDGYPDDAPVEEE